MRSKSNQSFTGKTFGQLEKEKKGSMGYLCLNTREVEDVDLNSKKLKYFKDKAKMALQCALRIFRERL